MGELTITRNLTAAGCNAQMELPLQSLVRDIIDAATGHGRGALFAGLGGHVDDHAEFVIEYFRV